MALKSAMKAPEASKVFVVRALDKFAPRSKEELEFKKGDLILVVDENAADAKFKGEVIKGGKVKGDKMGWFPTWYVRKEEKEKLPEMPASLMPKKPEAEKVKKGVNVAEPTDSSPKPAKAEVETTPRVNPDGSGGSTGGAAPVASDDKLTTAQKRSKFQKIQSIRTLQLKNEDDDDEDLEPESEPAEEEPTVNKDNRSEYMKNVASNMVSKMVFMNKKRVPPPPTTSGRESRSRASTTGDTPKPDSTRKDNRKSIFASLRPDKDKDKDKDREKDRESKDKKKETTSSADDVRTSRSTTETKASTLTVAPNASSANSKKPQSAPGSVARSSVTPIAPRTDALSIQQFLAQPLSPRSQSQNPSPSSSTSNLPLPTSAPPTPVQPTNRQHSARPGVTSSSGSSSAPEPDSSPDHSQQHSPRLRAGSRSTTDLLGRGRAQSSTPGSSSHSGPESEPSSMGRRSGKTAARAVIVEEDEPVAQSAAVQQFNPEGKNIEIICEIGKGATSSVWKGAIDGEFVALKQVSLLGVKNPKAMRLALKEEVELMKGFNHPNILKYHAMFYSRVNQEINIVLELVDGASASKLIGKTGTSEPLAAQMIYQVLEAVLFLNRHHIIHRDIKPQNLLVNSEGIVKLIDFGTVARLVNGVTHRNSTVGTPWYVAPEVINGERYAYPADMWSVGCSVLEMCTGKPPYHDLNSVAALFKMVEDDHPPLPSQISEPCKVFVLGCFQREPSQRITAAAAQQSPFVALRAPVPKLAAAVRALSTKEEEFVL